MFDYKKEQKSFYLPKEEPSVIEIPSMQFAAVRGKGNPNDEEGEYASALSVLYGISYTIKMSYKGSRLIDGFFEYTVPPLEGLWWMGDGTPGVDYNNKSGFHWISMIRLPEFVTADIFQWAKEEAAKKKKIDTSKAELFAFEEGLCIQCLHKGSYNDEPTTLAMLDQAALSAGCQLDFSETRRHHEIYLNDPRKTVPEKLKTVLRHPIKKL